MTVVLLKQLLWGGNLSEKSLLYSVCTAVDYCQNNRSLSLRQNRFICFNTDQLTLWMLLIQSSIFSTLWKIMANPHISILNIRDKYPYTVRSKVVVCLNLK